MNAPCLLSLVLGALLAACGTTAGSGGVAPPGDALAADASASDGSAFDVALPDGAPVDTLGQPGDAKTADAAKPGDTTAAATFELPKPGSTLAYRIHRGGTNGTFDAAAHYGTPKTLGGVVFQRVEVGDFKQADTEGFVFYNRFADGQVQFGGSEVYNKGDGANEPDFAILLDTPVGGPVDAPAGYSATTKSDGQMCFGKDCTPFHVEATFTIVARDVTVDTAFGKVTGCLHIHIKNTATDLGDFVLETDWYAKSGIGMVKAQNPPGFEMAELLQFVPAK